jgi:hypothetical protein
MAPEKFVSRHPLENGLVLEFWDLSRPTAGDRWQVTLEARIAVPVEEGSLPPELKGQLAEVLALLGPEVRFSHQETRNFVDQARMPALLQEMESWIWASVKRYVSHPEFAPRFLRQQYQKQQERARWYREG